MYASRTEPAFRFGPVRCGASDENAITSPALPGTHTASSACSKHLNPIGGSQCSSVPPLCSLGAIHGQPFSASTSTNGIQSVKYSCDSMNVLLLFCFLVFF